VRSWFCSALIEADAEDQHNKQLLLDHLRPKKEPMESVRYWILGGLYRKNVSYLREAVNISLEDDSRLMNSLGRSILTPEDKGLIKEFSEDISSSDAEIMLVIFRVMRIVPLPALAEQVCHYIISNALANLTFDAIYAISNPPCAKVLSDYLDNDLWDIFVGRMIQLLRSSEESTKQNFAGLLFGINRDQALITLKNVSTTSADQAIAGKLIAVIKNFSKGNLSNFLMISGYNADTIDVKADLLDITREVKTFTAIMLARNLNPPLAIGLFGNWGSGKSFFMDALQDEIKQIQNEEFVQQSDTFCTKVVQIKFNAWHYIDQNLWASLADVIFEQLNIRMSPPVTYQQQKTSIEKELSKAQQEEVDKKAERVKINEALNEKQQQLTVLEEARIQQPVKISDLTAEDLSRFLNAEQKSKLDETLKELGVPEAAKTVEKLQLLRNETSSLTGRIYGILNAVINAKNRKLYISIFFLFFLGIPGLFWLLYEKGIINAAKFQVGAFVANTCTLLSSIIALINYGLSKVRNTVKVVEDVKSSIDRLIEEKKAKKSAEEKKLEDEVNNLQEAIKVLNRSIETASTEVKTLEESSISLDKEYSLTRFLADTKRSEELRKQQGIISRIRRDFDELSNRLNARNVIDSKNAIERIILYIDDLDRCPPDKIMEVLQAVHLMLAYRLFVVVVGVDPRWLLSSLNSSFAAFQQSKQAGQLYAVQETTPQLFLEKIFQIPFCLRPMSADGFGNLMDALLKPSQHHEEETETTDKNPATLITEEAIPISGTAAVQPPVSELSGEPIAEPEVAPVPPSKKRAGPQITFQKPAVEKETYSITEEALQIQEWETQFAKQLYQFILTPRSAKRFTNIYRIIKAHVNESQLQSFEGIEEVPGDFQVVMILLAIQLGNAQNTFDLFRNIYQQAQKGLGLKNALQSINSRDNNFSSILLPVFQLKDLDRITKDPQPIIDWLPLISRFSFNIGTELIASS